MSEENWIPMSDRMPTEKDANSGGLVLFSKVGGPMQVYPLGVIGVGPTRWTHWRRAPEPPTEQGKEGA